MRIALVLAGGLHPSGRVEVIPAWLALVESLARAHEVHAFILRHLPAPTTYPLAGALVHDLGRPQGLRRQWTALGRALDAAGPFDALHGYWVDPAGLQAALAGRRRRIPTVVSFDSGELTAAADIGYGLQADARGRLAVALARRLATRVHVTSRYMETLARAHGLDVVRIPMGVDLGRIRLRLERPDGPPWRLLQVASVNRVKDQSTLLRAVAEVRQRLDARLDLVGEDTLGGRLQREVDALGLTPAVTLHGFVPHDELTPLRHGAHLYVQSSRHEAAGVSVLEAAAAGLPIVGTSVGYVDDWKHDAAVAVPPADAGALSAAIVRLLRAPAERRALAEAARRFAVTHDVGWTAARLIELYGSLRRPPRGQSE